MQTAVVPDQLRSRVAGTIGMINCGARPLGEALNHGSQVKTLMI